MQKETQGCRTRSALKLSQNSTATEALDSKIISPKPERKVYVGRRTGKLIVVNQGNKKCGVDDLIDDWFPKTVEDDEENISPKEPECPVREEDKAKYQDKHSGPQVYYGRHTGAAITINHKKDKHGLDCIADYFPEKLFETSLPISTGKKVDESVPITCTTDTSADKTNKDKQPGTESPNLTGTAVKTNTDLNNTDAKFCGSKKRLFTSFHLEMSESPVENAASPSDKTTGDIDITGISSDEEDIDVENATTNSNHMQSNSRASDINQGKEQGTQPNEDSFIEVIENDDSTFVTLGSKAKSSRAMDVSEIDVEGDGFQINESVVLDGTKHKAMSPVFGVSKEAAQQVDKTSDSEVKSKKKFKKKKSVARNDSMDEREKEIDVSKEESKTRRSTRNSRRINASDVSVEHNVSDGGVKAEKKSVFVTQKGRPRKSAKGKQILTSSDVPTDKSFSDEQDLNSFTGQTDLTDDLVEGPKPNEQQNTVSTTRLSSVITDKHSNAEQALGDQTSQNTDTTKAYRRSSKGTVSSVTEKQPETKQDFSSTSTNLDTNSNSPPKTKSTRKSTRRTIINASAAKSTDSCSESSQLPEKAHSSKRKYTRKSTRGKENQSVERLEHGTLDKGKRKVASHQPTNSCESQEEREVPDDHLDTSGDTTNKNTTTGEEDPGTMADDDNDYCDDGDNDHGGVGDGSSGGGVGGDSTAEDFDDHSIILEVDEIAIDGTEEEGDDTVTDEAGVDEKENKKENGDGENKTLSSNNNTKFTTNSSDGILDDHGPGRSLRSKSLRQDKSRVSSAQEDLKKDDEKKGKKAGGRPKKSTHSVLETSRQRDIEISPKVAEEPTKRRSKERPKKVTNSVLGSSPDNIEHGVTGAHNMVTNGNNSERDASQLEISSDSSTKNSSSGSGDEKKSRKRRKRMCTVIPRQLKRPKAKSTKSSSEGETSEGEDKKQEAPSVSSSKSLEGSPERTLNKTKPKSSHSRKSLDSNSPSGTLGVSKTPFGHPIRSILKSSLPRSHGSDLKKRRVSITTKKHQTHSDDGDEGDEDGASTSTYRRRSSVSFAPTPSFRMAPDDSMSPESTLDRTPSLSFIDKEGSFTLDDQTFTPGNISPISPTSSSIGSTSAISTDGYTFDYSQEITISSEKRHDVERGNDEGELGVRRSKRTKIPALKYWKNERIKYTRRRSGWNVDGIESVPTPKEPKRKKRTQNRTRTKMNKKSVYDGYGGDEPESFDNVPEDMVETACDPLSVINPYDGQEVKLDLLHLPQMLQFVNSSQMPAKPEDPLLIDKYVSHTLFGIGQLILRPGAEKGMQHVRKDTMVFHVLTGQVEATIHNTTCLLPAGSTFFVPEGNCYNLKNARNTDTRLFFVQIKATEK